MFCNNCGKENESQSKFCIFCGVAIGVSQESSAESNRFPLDTVLSETQENYNEQMQNLNTTVAVINKPNYYFKNDNLINSTNKPNSKVAIIIAIVIVILGSTLAFARNEIALKSAPKLYIGKKLENTIENIGKEFKKSQNAIGTSEIGKDESLTYEIGANLDSVSSESNYVNELLEKAKGFGFNCGVYYNKNRNEAIAQGGYTYKDDQLVGFSAFINDEELGFNIPQLFETYCTVPTENFGKVWNDSFIGESSGTMLSDDLDITLTKIKSMLKNELSEETKKAIKEANKALIDKIRVTDTSNSKVKIGDKQRNAKKISVIVAGDSFKEYIDDLLVAYKNDSQVIENYQLKSSFTDGFSNVDYTSVLNDKFNELRNNLKDKLDFEDNLTISIYEYKGSFVKFVTEFSADVNNDNVIIALDLSFTGEDSLINNISFTSELNVDDEKIVISINSKGNHIPKNGIYSDDTSFEILIPNEDKAIFESNCEINTFKKDSNLKGSISLKSREVGKLSIDYAGKYDTSKGIGLELNNLSVNYKGENSSESFIASGSLKLKYIQGDSGKIIEKEDRVYILDLNEYEIQAFYKQNDIVNKAEELGEKFNGIF